MQGYEAANILWNRAVAAANEIINLLYPVRESLRVLLTDSSIPESVREDTLARVTKLNDAEQQLTASLLTIKMQLFHVYPPQTEKQNQQDQLATDPALNITSDSLLVN